MEAIGAGAAVLPFVLLCLQSAKVAYTTISSIKDAPKQVKQLQREAGDLVSALERLSKCRVLGVAGNRDDVLVAKIKACQADIDTYSTRLGRLAPGATDHCVETTRKRLKVVVNEKDLAKMSAAMVAHTTALSLHLNAIQSDQIFEIHSQLGTIDQQGRDIHQTIHDNHTMVVNHNTSMQTVVTGHNAAMQSTVLDHNTTMRAAVLDHNTLVQSRIVDHNAAMQSIVLAHNAGTQAAIIESNQTVQSAVTSQNLEVQTTLQDVASNLGQAMHASTAVASAQSESAAKMDTVLAMLGQVIERLTVLPQTSIVGPLVTRVEENGCTSGAVSVNDKIPAEDDTSPYGALESSVRSILAAVEDRQGIFSVKEARDVVKPFVSFLQALSSEKIIESTEVHEFSLHRCCQRPIRISSKNGHSVRDAWPGDRETYSLASWLTYDLSGREWLHERRRIYQ